MGIERLSSITFRLFSWHHCTLSRMIEKFTHPDVKFHSIVNPLSDDRKHLIIGANENMQLDSDRYLYIAPNNMTYDSTNLTVGIHSSVGRKYVSSWEFEQLLDHFEAIEKIKK